eukprot:4328066-Alexandrium_andersonii.AAC.1
MCYLRHLNRLMLPWAMQQRTELLGWPPAAVPRVTPCTLLPNPLATPPTPPMHRWDHRPDGPRGVDKSKVKGAPPPRGATRRLERGARD